METLLGAFFSEDKDNKDYTNGHERELSIKYSRSKSFTS